ncbi:MAG: HAD family hydrolase [Planctomycetia bacterium]|nr:HAD family hydrolase [Planctomycetia bacterium]
MAELTDANSGRSRSQLLPDGVVLFDAVGTLLRPEPAVAEAYAAAGARYGSRLSRTDIDAAFRRVFTAEKAADLRDNEGRTDEARERERWRAIVAGVFDDVPAERRDALFEELWNHFAAPSSWRLFDDVRPMLKRLIAAGRSVAIASNFDRRLTPIVATLLPEIPLERVFVSSLVGYRKPATGFFRASERKLVELGITTKSCTLIGDDIDEDFHGAQAANWQAMLLDRDDRYPGLTPRIRSLDELL